MFIVSHCRRALVNLQVFLNVSISSLVIVHLPEMVGGPFLARAFPRPKAEAQIGDVGRITHRRSSPELERSSKGASTTCVRIEKGAKFLFELQRATASCSRGSRFAPRMNRADRQSP